MKRIFKGGRAASVLGAALTAGALLLAQGARAGTGWTPEATVAAETAKARHQKERVLCEERLRPIKLAISREIENFSRRPTNIGTPPNVEFTKTPLDAAQMRTLRCDLRSGAYAVGFRRLRVKEIFTDLGPSAWPPNHVWIQHDWFAVWETITRRGNFLRKTRPNDEVKVTSQETGRSQIETPHE